ncbi:hypothetical protein SELMODRAFT_425178 [Selaginella moellendorffii]|uniref:Uncharacterized protein n=1 Tax=Selaginella moellendorffii TaxID=88036 RepID=D8SS93_SELML|nr:hypothetical protein SELMODRAFT_425178 [Selaginella moellendorffii]
MINLLFVKVRNGTTLIFYIPAWKETVLEAKTDYSEYEVQYYIIMPENIKQTDLLPDEQVGEVPIVDVQFKKLSDVRNDLGYFDQRLMLAEPSILQPRVMDYCMGRNRDDYTPCGNWVERGGYWHTASYTCRNKDVIPDKGYFKK